MMAELKRKIDSQEPLCDITTDHETQRKYKTDSCETKPPQHLWTRVRAKEIKAYGKDVTKNHCRDVFVPVEREGTFRETDKAFRETDKAFRETDIAFREADIMTFQYLLGDDGFLTVGTLKNEMYIHIGRYGKFGSVNYPSREGVVFTFHQFIALTIKENKDSSSLDIILSDNTQAHELRVQISPAIEPSDFQMVMYPLDDRQYLFTCTPRMYNEEHQLYDGCITLNYKQWCQVFTYRAVVIEKAITVSYTDARLLLEYELISRCTLRPLHYVVYSQTHADNHSLAQIQLLKLLIATLRNHIVNAGFFPFLYDSDTSNDDKLFHFNLCLLELNFTEVVKDFYDSVFKETSDIKGSLEYYVTLDFFDDLNLLEIISQLRAEMCPGVERYPKGL